MFQSVLLERPDAGKIIPGSGGIRKLRWSTEGRGKRGGVRLIYYSFTAQETALLLFMYSKNVQNNLTQDQLKIPGEKKRKKDYHFSCLEGPWKNGSDKHFATTQVIGDP